MKRSEAIKLIEQELIGTPTSDDWGKTILDAVEKIGMLPPEALVPVNRGNPNYPEFANYKEWSHEWEPED